MNWNENPLPFASNITIKRQNFKNSDGTCRIFSIKFYLDLNQISFRFALINEKRIN